MAQKNTKLAQYGQDFSKSFRPVRKSSAPGCRQGLPTELKTPSAQNG